MKPFLFLLGLIMVMSGLLFTMIRNQNRLMNKIIGCPSSI